MPEPMPFIMPVPSWFVRGILGWGGWPAIPAGGRALRGCCCCCWCWETVSVGDSVPRGAFTAHLRVEQRVLGPAAIRLCLK